MPENMRLIISVVICGLLGISVSSLAQKKDYGRINGGVEINMGYYLKDHKLGIEKVEDAFAINSYVLLGYQYRDFRFGLQYELYEPPLLGYSALLKGNKLIQGFAEYQGQRLEIRLGSIYEQFGNGLIFRTYEDRTLGVNNSVLGGRIVWRPADFVTLKVLAGIPRKFLEYAETGVYGADIEMNVSDLFPLWDRTFLQVGGSWLLRDDHEKERVELAASALHLYAGRLNFNRGIFSLGGEYVAKSSSLAFHSVKGFVPRRGSALLLNLGIDEAGMGFSAEFRRLENMEVRMDDRTDMESVALNFLPSLTRQHKYTLASLFPHEVKGVGEIGGQFDFFGEIGWGKTERSPLKFTLNGAMYRKLSTKEGTEEDYNFWQMNGKLTFAEAGLEMEQRWGKKWKGILSFIWQRKNEFSNYGFGDMDMNSHILIGDLLYKFTPGSSLRMELQHMWSDSKDDQRWMTGLLEYGFVPHWMVYVSDLYNYKSVASSIHYYTLGGSYVRENLRASLNYGRNRAGLQCSGGVCRYIPEYSGLNMLLTYTF